MKLYRRLPLDEFHKALEFCEEFPIPDWDVWNAEELCFPDATYGELGLEESDWELLFRKNIIPRPEWPKTNLVAH